MWILIIVVLLIICSVLFGGFQKGTKATGLAPLAVTTAQR